MKVPHFRLVLHGRGAHALPAHEVFFPDERRQGCAAVATPAEFLLPSDFRLRRPDHSRESKQSRKSFAPMGTACIASMSSHPS